MEQRVPASRASSRGLQIALLLLAPIFFGACGNEQAAEPVEIVDQATEAQAPAFPTEPAEPVEPTQSEPGVDPAAAGPTTYVVVSTESSASYHADEEFFEGAVDRFNIPMGRVVTVGTTSDVSGQLVIEKTDPPAIVSGEIRVGLGSLTSDQNRRDQQVQERLNIPSFPDAVFVPTSIEGFPQGYTEGQPASFQIVGDMTLVGLSQPLTFDATATLVGGRIEAEAQTSFLLSSFGIEPPSFMGVFNVEDLLTVNVSLVLTEEPQASSGAAEPAAQAAGAVSDANEDSPNQGGPGAGPGSESAAAPGSASSTASTIVSGAAPVAAAPGVAGASSDAPAPFLGMPSEPHPLQVSWLRNHPTPGSDLIIEQTLAPGSNYDRFVASYLSDGHKIFALLTIPHGEKPASGWPTIVFNHGYIPPAQYRTTERYIAYTDAFSRNGYIVLKSDYRGHGSSEGEASGGYGSPDYTVDVLNGLASLKRHPDVDDNRIGMWGHSMGGHITLRAMVVDDSIKAGVIWAGVVASYTDRMNEWRQRDAQGGATQGVTADRRRGWRTEIVTEFGEPEQNPEFWASLSPNSYLADLSGPIQLHHGTADHSVPVEYSQDLQADLEAIGWPSELHIYQGDDHNIAAGLSTALQRSVDFFNGHVKGQ